MAVRKGYAPYIKPLLYIVDFLILSSFVYFFLSTRFIDILIFGIFWILLSVSFSFYKVYRFTKIIKILVLVTRQIFVFVLLVFSYFYIDELVVHYSKILSFASALYFTFIFWRITLHILFKKYRIITGSNYKQVVIVGLNQTTSQLADFFDKNREYGYKFLGFFTNKKDVNRLGDLEDSFKFIVENDVDEVYCSVKALSNDQIKMFIEFCDVKMKLLKFIPDNKELFSKSLYLNYYDLIPILALRKIPLDDFINAASKRVFDILFSLIIVVFVLSWLIPLLGIIIILESKGPIFFRQDRPGIREQGFGCYKFRSMTVNSSTEKSATRNDVRVTKVGKFIRKTSIDELPQFFNVLFGSMSVVGPRPHLWRQNEIYGNKIAKYMVRYLVKPGITGLAQVKGYRGEIETREDILHRTKYDIFYIENWSLLMDINIIIQTVLNVFKGEDKAY